MDAIYEETEVKMIEEVESCFTVVDIPSSKKKKRSKGSGEHADKPKKPRSAYLLYYFDVHQSLQHEHPDMPQSEINKRISDSWKRLNVADKGYYLERAKMEKEGVDPTMQLTSSSQDVPGFRKILPRANYIFLPKGSGIEERPGGSVELCMEGGVETLVEESHQTPQEPLVPPLTLGSEVELVEQCIAIEALSEDKALGRPAVLQGVLSQYSTTTPRRSLTTFAQDGHHSTTLLVKEDECRVVAEAYGGVGMALEEGLEDGAVMPQVKVDTTQLVAIIPNQELVENKIFPSASPIMMLPVMNRSKQDSKPSFKLSIKYTRRGRGSCNTPGCSFSYVTRHKPPQCPECGQHLGGKWVPAATKGAEAGRTSTPRKQQKDQSEESSSSSSAVVPQNTVLSPNTETEQSTTTTQNNSTQTTTSIKISEDSTAVKTETGSVRVLKTGRRRREKTGAATAQQPADGAHVKKSEVSPSAESTGVIGGQPSGGHIRVIAKEKSSSGAGPKRRIRAILPAPSASSIPSQPAVVQWIAVQPNKIKSEIKINSPVKPPSQSILGLKPSTLKQLGHSVAPSAFDQKPTPINSNQYIVTDNGVKILSMVPFKQNSGTSLALGLSTARGRGRCKNPSCDYIYKNRHKPQFCPRCGCELTTKTPKKTKASLEVVSPSVGQQDPSQHLTPAQRELQRQSTVTLLKHSLQFPENETELHSVFSLIHSLNQAHTERDKKKKGDSAPLQNGWPSFYEPAATHCSLCHYPLYRGEKDCWLAGQHQCWLLTESLLKVVSLQLKVCLNLQCLIIHSFTDLHPALFNVGNQLLVSLDLFFRIRAQIRLGQNPALVALDILNNTHVSSGCVLSSEMQTHLQELLCSGYWAFECLTVRDYNDMICGVCGIAPKLEIAQRKTNIVLQLKNVEFTWPEYQASEEVQVEEFWLAMESEALEQAAFPTSVSITRFDASIIAPFFPPLMRSSVVINTEKDKITPSIPHTGDPSVLVRLIHDGQLRPEVMDQHTEEELRHILEQCGVLSSPDSTKEELMVSVCLLYTQIQNGLSTASHPPHSLTAGKLSKVCPHQVVCGSKYLVRGETARDHVDLLVSSRFWPPAYVADCAQKVALCTDVLYPELASQMWGRNQGCFSDPMAPAEYVSCSELQDQPYTVDLSSVDSNPRLHPITKSLSRWVVRPGGPTDSSSTSNSPPPDPHHAITLCKELQPYSSLASELTSSSEDDDSPSGEDRGSKALVFDNPAHYYLYNRLVDFMSSRDIVSQQIAEVLKVCQQGEVVMIRDALYRLGLAQLNTEEEQGIEEGEGDMDAVTVEDMVLE